jgi:cysteine-rich repeat protein
MLKTLDLSYNNFYGPVPTTRYNWNTIGFINLNTNNINGSFSDAVTTMFHPLGSFDINNNCIDTSLSATSPAGMHIEVKTQLYNDWRFTQTNCAVTTFCGNGMVEVGEACDDGNTVSGDGCSYMCSVEDAYICVAPSGYFRDF